MTFKKIIYLSLIFILGLSACNSDVKIKSEPNYTLAEEYGIDLEVTKIVDKFYLELQKMGHNRLDTSSLIKRLTD